MARGGIRTVSENFEKMFLTFLGLGTNVVKVSSVNSELLFQWDTLVGAVPPGMALSHFIYLVKERAATPSVKVSPPPPGCSG